MNWQTSVERTVTALGYEVVDCERSSHGLLRVFIDRVPGQVYPGSEAGGEGAEFVTVDDCERVTRQLQYALEVDGCDYARLEVSSPGLDRPLKKPADFVRFADSQVDPRTKPNGADTFNDASTPPSAEAAEERWIDENSTPLLINRYNGTLVRGE